MQNIQDEQESTEISEVRTSLYSNMVDISDVLSPTLTGRPPPDPRSPSWRTRRTTCSSPTGGRERRGH